MSILIQVPAAQLWVQLPDNRSRSQQKMAQMHGSLLPSADTERVLPSCLHTGCQSANGKQTDPIPVFMLSLPFKQVNRKGEEKRKEGSKQTKLPNDNTKQHNGNTMKTGNPRSHWRIWSPNKGTTASQVQRLQILCEKHSPNNPTLHCHLWNPHKFFSFKKKEKKKGTQNAQLRGVMKKYKPRVRKQDFCPNFLKTVSVRT